MEARLVRDAHVGVLWEGTSNINALDVITRATPLACRADPPPRFHRGMGRPTRRPQRTASPAAERVAINTPVQGSAADLIKKAMLTVDARLRNEFPGQLMLLQVHDELVFEAPAEEREALETLER